MQYATNESAPAALFFEQSLIEVLAYSFTADTNQNKHFTAPKIFLDILFQHPRTAETITMRTTAPVHLLYCSKEEIERVVYQEIRSLLQFQAEGIL